LHKNEELRMKNEKERAKMQRYPRWLRKSRFIWRKADIVEIDLIV